MHNQICAASSEDCGNDPQTLVVPLQSERTAMGLETERKVGGGGCKREVSAAADQRLALLRS